jgi:hypothetical protein
MSSSVSFGAPMGGAQCRHMYYGSAAGSKDMPADPNLWRRKVPARAEKLLGSIKSFLV